MLLFSTSKTMNSLAILQHRSWILLEKLPYSCVPLTSAHLHGSPRHFSTYFWSQSKNIAKRQRKNNIIFMPSTWRIAVGFDQPAWRTGKEVIKHFCPHFNRVVKRPCNEQLKPRRSRNTSPLRHSSFPCLWGLELPVLLDFWMEKLNPGE